MHPTHFSMPLFLKLLQKICFLFLLGVSSCTNPPYRGSDVLGADEFVMDSYRIREGKLSILSMQGKESKTLTKGGMRVTQNLEKWNLLTTHTARRSFATNEYLQGTEMEMIKAITGHTTEKSFMKYIKVTPTQHAKRLDLIWGKRYNKETKIIAL